MSEHDDMVESSWSAIEWFARINKADGIAVEVTADETDDECAMLLSDYVKALGARQLSETVERNVAALLANPALAFSVVKSYANTRMFDTSEMYVSSLGVVIAACGLVPIADPLGEYRECSGAGKTPRNRRVAEVHRRRRGRGRPQREPRVSAAGRTTTRSDALSAYRHRGRGTDGRGQARLDAVPRASPRSGWAGAPDFVDSAASFGSANTTGST